MVLPTGRHPAAAWPPAAADRRPPEICQLLMVQPPKMGTLEWLQCLPDLAALADFTDLADLSDWLAPAGGGGKLYFGRRWPARGNLNGHAFSTTEGLTTFRIRALP